MMERIAKAGAGFRSITENIDTTTPAGRMMMQMVGAARCAVPGRDLHPLDRTSFAWRTVW